MVGQSNDIEVTCCFCGEGLFLKDATVLLVYPNVNSDDGQQLYCHKNHFLERLHKSIPPLHPDFFEEEGE